jgi:hypothetical protein
LKSPWEVKFKLDLQGEIDVCENRDIILFWWLVARGLFPLRIWNFYGLNTEP